MKKLFLGLVFTAIALVGPSASATDVVIKKTELPATAQAFIKEFFNDKEVSFVLMDKGLISNEYKVKFVDNVEIEFDSNGVWEEVDGNKTAITTRFIEPAILNYVKEHFAGVQITKIDKSFNSFEIKLSNGLELEFSKKGKFIRIDD